MTGRSELLEDDRLADLRERLEHALRRVGAKAGGDTVARALDALQQTHGSALANLAPADLYRAAHAAIAPALRATRHPEDPGAQLRTVLRQLPAPRSRAIALYLLGHPVPDVGGLLGVDMAEAEHVVYRGLAEVRATLPRDPAGGPAHDDVVRLRERFTAGGDPSQVGCLAPERLYAAATGELPTQDVTLTLDHATACPACAQIWRLALELEPRDDPAEVIPLFPHGPPGPRRPHPDDAPPPFEVQEAPLSPPTATATLRRATAIAIAAFLALGALVALTVLPTYVRPSSTVPAPSPLPVGPPPAPSSVAPPVEGPTTRVIGAELRARDESGAQWSLVTPAAERIVAVEDVALTWSGGPAGSRYDVVVTDAHLYPLTRVAGLAEPVWTLPASVVAGRSPGERLLWRVEALTPSGQRLSSPTWSLTVGDAP